MAVLMCLTVFVLDWSGFFPGISEAEAATAGKYTWKVELYVKEQDGDCSSCTWSLSGKKKNGAGDNVNKSNVSQNMAGNQESVYTLWSGTNEDFFPLTASVTASNTGCNDCDVQGYLRLYIDGVLVKEDQGQRLSVGHKSTASCSYSFESVKPYADSLSAITGMPSTYTIPAYGTNASQSYTVACTAYDQYQRVWYDDPSVSITAPTSTQITVSGKTITINAPTDTKADIKGSKTVTAQATLGDLTQSTSCTLIPTYRIVFNARQNGGAFGSSLPTDSSGDIVTTITNESTDGKVDYSIDSTYVGSKNTYTFRGWSLGQTEDTNTDNLYAAGDQVELTALNSVFYAQFSKDVTVRPHYYNADSHAVVNNAPYLTATAWNNATTVSIDLPAAPDPLTLGGTTYNATGWAKNPTATTGLAFNSTQNFNVPSGNTTPSHDIYAVYSGSYQLSYDRNRGEHAGGTDISNPAQINKKFNCGANANADNLDLSTTLTVAEGFQDIELSLERSEFTGYWATDAGFDGDLIDPALDKDEALGYYKSGSTITFSSSITLYAAYTYLPLNVIYKDYDGSVLESQQIKYGLDSTPPTIEDNSHTDAVYHYNFRSWVGGVASKWDNGIYTEVVEDVTFYATYSGYGHRWVQKSINKTPSCTENGIEVQVCEVCGRERTVSIPLTGHEPIVRGAVAPTCTEPGNNGLKVCARCGYVYPDEEQYTVVDGVTVQLNQTEDALGHDWLHEEVGTLPAGVTAATVGEGDEAYTLYTKASTCVQNGYTYKICERCGQQETVTASLDLADHTEKTVAGIPATCTSAGQSDYIVCEVCGELLVSPVTVRRLGHDLTHHEAVIPQNDCTADGAREYWTCDRCGKYFLAETAKAADEITGIYTTDPETGDPVVDPELLAAALRIPAEYEEHDFVVYTEAVEPTCTVAGHSAGKMCSRCGFVPEGSTAFTTEPALGHDWDEGVHTASETPCLTHGYTTYTCRRDGCGETNVVYDTDELVPHTEVTTEGTPSTCYAFGTTGHAYCSVCGEVLSEYTLLAKTAHTFDTVIAPEVAATCTGTGTTAKSECSVCRAAADEGLIEEEDVAVTGGTTIPALGHDYTGWTVTAVVTCTEGGSKFRRCLRCDAVETVTTEALGHQYVDVAEVDATCEAPGHTAGTVCTRCGDYTYTVIDQRDHTYGEWEILQPATCGEAGMRKKVCADCGDEVYEEIEKLAEHQGLTPIAAVDATCTSNGLTAGEYCTVCGEITVPQEIVPIADHVAGTAVNTDPTCVAPGMQGKVTCVNCGKVLVAGRVIPALGHTYGEYTVVSTLSCTTDGVRTRTCTRCNGTLGADPNGKPAVQTVQITARGHNYVTSPAVPATCTATGLTAGEYCSACGLVKVAQTVVPQKEHVYISVETLEATCTLKGYTVYKCEYCQNTKKDNYVPALGHTGGTATCVDKAVCTRCGNAYGRLADHNYAYSAADSVAGTCVQREVKGYRCTVCNELKTETGDYGDHVYDIDNAVIVPATCTQPGTGSAECIYCHQVGTMELEPALGHNYENGACTRCGEPDPNYNPGASQGSEKCEKCGLNHNGRTGLWKQDGFFCKIISFFRNLFKIFG